MIASLLNNYYSFARWRHWLTFYVFLALIVHLALLILINVNKLTPNKSNMSNKSNKSNKSNMSNKSNKSNQTNQTCQTNQTSQANQTIKQPCGCRMQQCRTVLFNFWFLINLRAATAVRVAPPTRCCYWLSVRSVGYPFEASANHVTRDTMFPGPCSLKTMFPDNVTR